MQAIRTESLTPSAIAALGETAKLWVYNALDCCITFEVCEQLKPQLDNVSSRTYSLERDMQGPVLEMGIRGVLVDQEERKRALDSYEKDHEKVQKNLDRIFLEGFGIAINHRSPVQLKSLFYDQMKLPVIRKRNEKGLLAPTVNRDALERLELYFDAMPIIRHILCLKDIEKKISVLKTSIDPDGRIRTSYNIAGTSTGRLSSSMSEFGTGGNMQNVEERLRRIFIADPGMKFAYIDLEQAESRLVAAICWNLFHDGTYLDACESGDLHTYVCKLTNPQIAWTGDMKKDKEIAEQPYYRQHSFRHMNKILGHGTNYYGKPNTMEKHTKIDSRVIDEFQAKYFTAFPAIPRWHEWVKRTLRDDGQLTSLMGRRRSFFGRLSDETTLREAIAFDPQGSVADILDTGMIRVWRERFCAVLLQVHDAILIQYPEELEDEVVPRAMQLLEIPIELNFGRSLVIPSEAKVGWNWSNWCCGGVCTNCPSQGKPNLDGLKKYSKGKPDERRRTRTPSTNLLDGFV